MAALGSVARRWAELCNGNPAAHFPPKYSTSAVAFNFPATANSKPSTSVPRLLPTSTATVTATATALAASSKVEPSAAARPPAQASAFSRGPGVPPQSHCGSLAKNPRTSCFSLADILVPGQLGGTQGEQVGDVPVARLPAAIADDDYYESLCGLHATAPDSPAWSSCRSDDSAGSDSDCDGGIDALQGPDAGTVADAGGSCGGPDDWLLLDALADASADGTCAGQGGELSPGLNAGQAVDMLLGEPGASTTPPPDGQPESIHGSWACGAWCMNDHYTIF